MSTKPEKRGERDRGVSEVERDDAVPRNTEEERASGMRRAHAEEEAAFCGVLEERLQPTEAKSDAKADGGQL